MTRTSILLAGVSIALLSAAPAGADPRYLFGGTGAVPRDQPVETGGGTVQILMDDGAIVSLVGDSSFRISGDALVVDRGGVTVVASSSNPLTIQLPGGGSAVVAGAASLTVSASGTTGNVMGGSTAITAGGNTSQFSAGMAWRASPSGADRVFANGAQAAPSGVAAQRGGGVQAAATNGLPIGLGEALAAIGAQGDLVAAANRLQAAAQNPALGALPSGDVSLLLGFSSQLAAALGGTTFQGSNSALIDVYLRYLATGGQVAQFQSAYAAIVAQYLQLLQSGGNAGQFAGLDPQALATYLGYLQSSGGLANLAEAQRGLITAYLAFLQKGGIPANFTVPGNYLSQATLTAYLSTVRAYLDYLYAGGVPSGYGGLSTAALQAYLQALTDAGLLASLPADQRDFLTAYAAYLRTGANPDAYAGLPDANITTTDLRLAYGVNRPGTTNATFGVSGNASVKRDKDGKPVRQLPLNGTAIDLTGATLVESAKSGELSVGRFSNFSFSEGGTRYTVGANQGVHFVLAPPLTNRPQSATLLYNLAAATHPTFGDGATAPGTFDGKVVVAYGGTTVKTAAEGSVAMPGDATYAFATAGGLAGVDALAASASPAFIQLTAALTGQGRACSSGGSGCGLYMAILPSGNGATSLAASYESRSGNAADASFTGAAGFALTGPYTPPAPPPPPAPTGGVENQFVAYIGNGPTGTFRTIDQRAPVRTLYDATTGAPTYYYWSDNENIGLGTATLADAASVGTTGAKLGWARWVNGTASGNFYGEKPVFGAGGGHFISGDVPTNVPTTGMFTYNLAGSTTPTASDGTLAALTSAKAAVSFGAQPLIGLEFALAHNNVTYTFGTPGGIAQTATSGLLVADPAKGFFFGGAGSTATNRVLTASGTGPACGTTCTATVRGYLGGAGAATLGLVYSLLGDASFSLAGSAGFTKGDAIGSTPSPTPAGIENQIVIIGSNGPGATKFLYPYLSARVAYDGATGGPTYFSKSSLEIGKGSTSLAEPASIGSAGSKLSWARWVNGTTAGGFSGQNLTLGASGLHILAGDLPSNLPASGLIEYILAGKTTPTASDGSFGELTSAKAAVSFGSKPLVGLELALRHAGADYVIQTPGGLAQTASSGLVIQEYRDGMFSSVYNTTSQNRTVTATGTGSACNSTCIPTVSGFLGGNGGATLGLMYQLAGANDFSILGSASFTKGGTYTPPAAPPFVGTPNQATAFAGTKVGIDNRRPTTVAYSSSGAPTGYRWELNDYTRGNEYPNIGSATEHESGSVASIIGWTRWAGGTTGGKLGSSAPIALAENTGWHIVSGAPATNLPASGTVNYALLGATAPTTRDASTAPGTFAGKLAVAFGAQPMVGIEFGITIGGASYAINTPGGVADPMQGMSVITAAGNENMFFFGPNLTATGSGAVCGGTGTCKANVQGFLAGNGASHVGVAYTFGNLGYDKQVDGVAVFAKAP